ncbi:hypothetical protein SLE2022_205150 [Rubroshorea leprosula]
MENNAIQVCIPMPINVSSGGYWGDRGYSVNEYSLPRLELQVALILLVTQIFHFLLKKLGIPIFFSQIIAGIVLGPGLRKLVKDKYENMEVLGTTAAIGFVLFVFQCAVKTDLGMMKKSGIMPWCIGVLSLYLPIYFGYSNTLSIRRDRRYQHNTIKNLQPQLLSSIFAMTSFPMVAMLLEELKILNSELGRLGLSSALVADLLGLTTSVVNEMINLEKVARHASSKDFPYYSGMLASPILAVIAAVFLLRPAMKWVVRNTPEDRPVKDFYVYAILFLVLLTTYVTRFNTVFLVWFPLVIGLAVPEGPPFGSTLVSKFDGILNGLLLPISVATISLRFNFSSEDLGNKLVHKYTFLCLETLVVKFCVSFVLSLTLCKMPIKDSASLALILNNRGVVDIGLFAFTYDDVKINDALYTMISLIFVAMGTAGPVLVKLLYDPSKKYAVYQKRNIADMKRNSELQIVACIHTPNDVIAMIKLLDVTCPNKENPLAINVLHLVKLTGRASSLFISHQKQAKTTSDLSYFGNATFLFYQFEQSNWGAVSVNVFTAVSPPNSMHDDICNLAFDKQSSLILLPFHQRWCPDGTIEFEDNEIRTLNSQILNVSPCSVGIFIDRATLSHHGTVSRSISTASRSSSSATSFNVAMIFLGGADDREALIFAKRFAQDDRASLTVIALEANTNTGMPEWDIMLDSVVLRDVKSTEGIKYMETIVKVGSETATILRSVASEYNLVVVGRRNNIDSPQTSGLKEWSEIHELGVIGDLLVSKDLEGTCSILIIQQQKVKR